MGPKPFTVIDDGRVTHVDAAVSGGTVRVTPRSLRSALGWDLRSQGLCRDDICIPTTQHADFVTREGVDLTTLAEILDRPLAVEPEAGVAALAASPRERGATLARGVAPDFELPDLEGNLHSLAEQRGKKVLLIAYASW